VIKPNVAAWNEAGRWPRDASSKAGDDGLMGLYCPPRWGGRGLSFSDGVRVYEELGKGDAAYAFATSMHNLCAYSACQFGRDAFQAEWAEALCSGRKLAGFSLTEPESGSDASNIQTVAEWIDDRTLRVNGVKAWVSLAGEADVYMTVAAVQRPSGDGGAIMLAVPADARGVSFGGPYGTPSYRFLPLANMYLKDVVLPVENVILPEGKGLSGALAAIDVARVSIAAGCCGLIETAMDTALAYARDRRMFGTRSLELDGIQFMLSDVATDLEIGRLLYRRAAEALGTEEGTMRAAQAKLYVPDAALRAANVCAQVLGGMGLISSIGLDRLSRLAQMLKIVDGTTEVQRVVIGRALRRRAASLPPVPIPAAHGAARAGD
jgi:alkylation response protein AidB-like acyl-CoA dehydrogenase